MALQFALNRLFLVTANLGSVFENVSEVVYHHCYTYQICCIGSEGVYLELCTVETKFGYLRLLRESQNVPEEQYDELFISEQWQGKCEDKMYGSACVKPWCCHLY